MTWLVLYCLAVGIVVAVAGIVGKSRLQKMQALASEDAAFEGDLDFYGLNDERKAELRGLIDRVGVIPGKLVEAKAGGSRGLVRGFDVFVIDIAGAVHDIDTLDGRQDAAELARKVSETFDVPIDDPTRVLSQ